MAAWKSPTLSARIAAAKSWARRGSSINVAKKA
jgi:hypothetical protein